MLDWFVLTTFAGWIGAACILLAFWLLTHKVAHSHSYIYLGLNLVGGFLLAIETYVHDSYASFALNSVWVIIAIYGLGWAHRRREPKKHQLMGKR
ncbi:hypothetical protein C4580_01380 [Candidatus Woesearchaeota archaeon]|nr:MAG: hypothetical protein C4580_01380 [Candidatus Woesearchaeota archaeon]